MGPIRHSLRLLRRSPGFSAIVILTLGLGIGANATIYSVVRSVLLRPLPYGNDASIVSVASDNSARGWFDFGVSVADLSDWQAQSRLLEHISGYWAGAGNLTGGDRPSRVAYATVSPSLLQALGTPPVLGRGFRPEENDAGRDRVVILSWRFWQTAMGGRADVLGETVFLDLQPLEIIGVMPEGFAFPHNDVAFWKPFGFEPENYQRRGARWLGVVATLAPEANLDEAGREMRQIAARLEQAYPQSNTGWTASVAPYRVSLTADVRPLLYLGWAAVAIVLLIASANVANLFLARATRRGQELAVRAALGAGRAHLVGRMVTESLVFAVLGGALGLLMALAGIQALRGVVPEGLIRLGSLSLDWTVIGYSVGLVGATALLFGLVPALRASRPNLDVTLRRGARGMASGSHRLRSGLVIAEVALAAVVLVGAGLTIRSFAELLAVDPGFKTAGRLALRVAPSRPALPERTDATAYYQRVLTRLSALPGVASTGAVSVLPVPGGTWWTSSIWLQGKTYAEGEQPVAATRIVSGAYFETMGIPLERGRTFRAGDEVPGAPVMVIDRTAADRYWPNEDPVGQLVSFDRAGGDDVMWYRVIGIVGAVRDEAVDVAPAPMAYMTLGQARFGHFMDWGMHVVVRGMGDPMVLAEPARAALVAEGPDFPVYQVRPLDAVVSADLHERRFTLTMLTVFGAIALLLAAVGVYAVLATMVAERTREIGMRMALGADRGRVLAWVLRDGLGKTAAGVAIGLTTALAASRLMSSLVFQISGTDPITYGAIAVVLGAVALSASAIPAWRATRVHPMEALRGE
jgi:putative ABC transport system permease protein